MVQSIKVVKDVGPKSLADCKDGDVVELAEPEDGYYFLVGGNRADGYVELTSLNDGAQYQTLTKTRLRRVLPQGTVLELIV